MNNPNLEHILRKRAAEIEAAAAMEPNLTANDFLNKFNMLMIEHAGEPERMLITKMLEYLTEAANKDLGGRFSVDHMLTALSEMASLEWAEWVKLSEGGGDA